MKIAIARTRPMNITGISACYDEGKRCVETLFFDYLHLMHSCEGFTGLKDIGNPQEFTMIELVEKTIEYFKSTIR